jgi:hypothetical protein
LCGCADVTRSQCLMKMSVQRRIAPGGEGRLRLTRSEPGNQIST